MKVINAEAITAKQIYAYLGKDVPESYVEDILDMIQCLPEVYGNGEICEWSWLKDEDGNALFKVQCNHNPLKDGTVPNNFSYHDFKYCPYCGRNIKWIDRAWYI